MHAVGAKVIVKWIPEGHSSLEHEVRSAMIGDRVRVIKSDDSSCTVAYPAESSNVVWEAVFETTHLAPDLEDWTFGASEVSAGHYRASGRGPGGISCEHSGVDPEVELSNCRAFALKHRRD